MTIKYEVIQTDAGNGLFEGQKVTPYYEDSNEIILQGNGDYDHHIRKSGNYFAKHLKIAGGSTND